MILLNGTVRYLGNTLTFLLRDAKIDNRASTKSHVIVD